MDALNADKSNPDLQSVELVHARVMQMFPELVRELGGDPDTLIREAVGDVGDSADGTPPVLSLRQGIKVIDFAATKLGCNDFGMRLAVLQSGNKIFGPVGAAMMNCSTYGEALHFAQTHSYAHSLAVSMWSQKLPHENAIFAGHEILLDNLPDQRQFLEQTLLAGNIAAKRLTNGKTRARRIHLRHEPIASLRTYHRHFGCDVLFDQAQYGIVFSERDLMHPILFSDQSQLMQATAYIEKHFNVRNPPLHTAVRGAILRRLGLHDCSNESIAEELNMHSRTLHRKLRSMGTSFQGIKNEVRKDLLLYFLHKTDLDLLHVSERLDFAEQSVMSRCCKRWFDASPSTLRKQGRAAH